MSLNKCLLICFSIPPLLFPLTAHAALSATTANTIQGTEPRLSSLLETQIGQKNFSGFGFIYNNVSYNDTNIANLPNFLPLQTTPANLRSQLTSTLTFTGDATDTDGDSNFSLVGLDGSNNPLAASALSIKIRDGKSTDITQSTKNFCDLGSSNPPPYKIEISNNLRLTTQYGDPRKKDYTVLTQGIVTQPSKQYTVTIAGACNLKPLSMDIYDDYNATKWDANRGFKATAGFPTTGFNKAKFQIIGAGTDQSKYKCERDSGGSWVNYSTAAGSTSLGAGCGITYNTEKKPTTSITIKISYNNIKVDSYTIPVPTKWALPQANTIYGDTLSLSTSAVFPTLNRCRNIVDGILNASTTKLQATGTDVTYRQKYLYRRNELTNASEAKTPELSNSSGGNFSRDVDSTFMGEWGDMSKYTGSGWDNWGWYWTSEMASTDNQFYASIFGSVSSSPPSNSGYSAGTI